MHMGIIDRIKKRMYPEYKKREELLYDTRLNSRSVLFNPGSSALYVAAAAALLTGVIGLPVAGLALLSAGALNLYLKHEENQIKDAYHEKDPEVGRKKFKWWMRQFDERGDPLLTRWEIEEAMKKESSKDKPYVIKTEDGNELKYHSTKELLDSVRDGDEKTLSAIEKDLYEGGYAKWREEVFGSRPSETKAWEKIIKEKIDERKELEYSEYLKKLKEYNKIKDKGVKEAPEMYDRLLEEGRRLNSRRAEEGLKPLDLPELYLPEPPHPEPSETSERLQYTIRLRFVEGVKGVFKVFKNLVGGKN